MLRLSPTAQLNMSACRYIYVATWQSQPIQYVQLSCANGDSLYDKYTVYIPYSLNQLGFHVTTCKIQLSTEA